MGSSEKIRRGMFWPALEWIDPRGDDQNHVEQSG